MSVKLAFSHSDKRRIIISLIVLILGAVIIAISLSPIANPPQCPGSQPAGSNCIIGANINVPLILGYGVVIIGTIAVLASIVYGLTNTAIRKPAHALLITILIVGAGTLFCWYIFVGADASRTSDYRAELKTRQADFVAYKGTPNIHSVSGQSTALSVTPAEGKATSVGIDLHNCSPGTAQVSYATGTTYFAFSGVQEDPNLSGSFNCIFYVGEAPAHQKWNGSLPAKCTGFIADSPDDAADNQLSFPVSSSGIDFGNFSGHCQDLKTGLAPNLN